MASPFERRSVVRKMIYFALILVLFTASLLHRKQIIAAEAERLLLRDVGKGKADLTSSAVRLTLSGARGFAITSLWMAAIEKQKRHQWNELETAVDSLTRLQPRFITPWVYQGWNLSFNVSVECDRIRDKYYYITRGIKLLCQGEEKNDPGQAVPPHDWPASPELRFEIANTYHRKIGQGDENKTLRCLFDLSCIPLSERKAELFYIAGEQGKQLNLDKFRQFCEANPRLVRRLRERLTGFDKPEDIVKFLADNKDIPCRIEQRNNLGPEKRLEEFPILPPQDRRAPLPYPDWRTASLATDMEDFDAFKCLQAWHIFAQIPLPPPNKDVGFKDEPPDRLKYRLPRFTTLFFRYYPALIQVFVSEELQKDGWFDESGWRIAGWFDRLTHKPVVIAGTGPRFDSARAWDKSYEWWKLYGTDNGIYLEPEVLKQWVRESLDKGPQSEAAKRIDAHLQNRERTRFDAFFQMSRVERTPEAIAARKAIFEVQHLAKSGDPNSYSVYGSKVLPQWLDLLLRYPEFRLITDIQEESYKLQAEYFWEYQRANREWLPTLLKDSLLAVPTWPLPGLLPPPPTDDDGKLITQWPLSFMRQLASKATMKVLPVREIEGPYDRLLILEGREAEPLKPLAMAMARQALWPPLQQEAPDFAFARFVVWPVPPGSSQNPEIGLGHHLPWPPAKDVLTPPVAGIAGGNSAAAAWPRPIFMMLSSAEQRLILTRPTGHRGTALEPGWIPLLDWNLAQVTRGNIAWMQVAEPPQEPPAGK